MKILTAAEMRETDRVTIETYGIASNQLMTQAGGAVARFALRQYPAAQSIVVICGMGNNGGDGLMAAGPLNAAGRGVPLVVGGRRDDRKGGPRLERVRQAGRSWWPRSGRRRRRLFPNRGCAGLVQASASPRSRGKRMTTKAGMGMWPFLRGATGSPARPQWPHWLHCAAGQGW